MWKLEYQNANGNVDRKDCVLNASDRNMNSIANLSKGHSRYIKKNFSTFCLYHQTLQEAEFKSDGQITLAEATERHPSIQAFAWVSWLH
jgi:hypothetical protein